MTTTNKETRVARAVFTVGTKDKVKSFDVPVIRASRSFESFSRGKELVSSIWAMWERNRDCRDSPMINKRIAAIVAEFDLTVTEWHYWCKIANR